ncbi:DUF418 domain-containing protein [Xenophilus arseniciresistens]|uniref:DUF418 domain-containing protein n=1 Tax=Xenophilus arseniciresistens TaxID=1283306 RepID=A0AAE3SZX6_9BURK|nr:DUF418 domain-containing protein [Xenophilus arseniciresistens]MDA7416331.1 DUF418 domain-containing protein [Xenophilus arseniciresistens]
MAFETGSSSRNTITEAQHRLAQVDGLRGFALLGILVVNSQVMASPYYAQAVADPAFSSPTDLAVRWLVALVFETKFYLLFSFLFGYSFTLQRAAADRQQAAFVPRWLRRLAGLALLGLAHALLFYPGDILLPYALLGLLLLGWRHLRPERALRRAGWVLGLLAVPWLLLSVLSLMQPWAGADFSVYEAQAQVAIASYRGDVASTVMQNLRDWRGSVWWQLMLVQGPFVVVMFLVGHALGTRQALAQPWQQPGRLRRWALMGLLPGLTGAVLYANSGQPAADPGWRLMGFAAGLLTSPGLSLAYACAFLLAWRTRTGQRVGAWLVPAGRMALSNYLMQSLVCAFIFTGWGLGLSAALPPLAVLGIAVGLYALQLPLSAWWLRRHLHGPVEWGLRALTLGRWPAWRHTPAV